MAKVLKLGWLAVAVLATCAPMACAMERVTLRNGSSFDCLRREIAGPDRIRLYLAGGHGLDGGYMEIAASAVAEVETIADPPLVTAKVTKLPRVLLTAEPTAAELHEILAHAGAAHGIDAELLASVVHAESGGRTHAISRTGARGLMQLMPATAAEVGVHDAFIADENVEGGTRYLDALLVRYHDNIALALAAYNAGPGAVDRYHGVPPYRETRAYVASVIREFNRRKTTLIARAR